MQIGIDPRRAIALSGMSSAAPLISLLDGSREREQLIAAAAAQGIPRQMTERVLTLLAAGGALDDFPAATLRALPPEVRSRLAPELATASLAHRDGDGGARALARRRNALVRVEGEPRVARVIARILSRSGVGQVEFVRLADPPGRAEHDRATAQPANRGPALQRGRVARTPDLVVMAGRQLGDGHATDLTRQRVAHLAVLAGEAIGVVGPLVLPGRTACLRCLDYARAANDPSWPLILAQIARRRPEPAACDTVLATAVAAQAAAQALLALDRSPDESAAVNGTLELVLPDWRWRRRTWPQHPACPCSSHTLL